MKKRLLLFLAVVLIALVLWHLVCYRRLEKKPPTSLRSAAGIETTVFQPHDSILFEARGLSPRTGYEVEVVREDGRIMHTLGLSTDANGIIPETIIWYDVGVVPCSKTPSAKLAVVSVSAQEITDAAIAGRTYLLRIRRGEELVRETEFRVAPSLIRPILYAADSRGCPQSGFMIGEEDVWVVGKNFPKGSLIRLWAVSASSNWKEGQPLQDVTAQYYGEFPPLIELQKEQTDFRTKLWPKTLESLGSYDMVAEVVSYQFGTYRSSAKAQAVNIVAHLSYSGFVIQRRPGIAEPLELDIAGSIRSPFAFRDIFLTTEDVYVGVDPCIQPSLVGKTAKVYIVADKTDAQWLNGTSLQDVTGFPETITVGGICGNCWSTLAWTHPLVVGKYDVVLDFDQDGFYDQGVDLIDSLNPAGFTVSEIRVDSISFNTGGAGTITIYDNQQGANIVAPEYLSAAHISKPAAWVRGGSYSVLVNFQAVPTVNSAQVWAETGFGGLASDASPITINFTGGAGQGTFLVNAVPNAVGKHEVEWDWKYKNANGSGPPAEMGRTGKHIVYTTLSAPIASMAVPWLEILDYACIWASQAATKEDVCVYILDNGFKNHYDWVGNCHWLASDFVRLVNTQGIAASLHYWGVVYTCYVDDMRKERTMAFDPVGSSYGHGTQDWIFHQWAEAEGKQRDPSAGTSLAGSWGDYENFLYEFYEKVTNTSCGRAWVAEQPGQNTGCEAAPHRVYNSNPAFLPWLGPDH